MDTMDRLSFIAPDTQFFIADGPFSLELGGELMEVQVAYRTWGELNSKEDNAVLICHALTGSADADSWWEGMFGDGKAFDPSIDFIICSNVLGSCYGTTGPLSLNPSTGKRYGPDFPKITIRDMVRLQKKLLDSLGIHKLSMVVGASLGGMQVLEWGAMYPEMVSGLFPMATSGRHSAWCIGQSEAQRQAIMADRDWNDGWYDPAVQPIQGLGAARMMAMCCYRSFGNFQSRFGRETREENGIFQIQSYLRHQGKKLVERFDANTYITLTHAMDLHDLSRGRALSYDEVLHGLDMPVALLSIRSDVLFLKEEQEELARMIPAATIEYLEDPHGHDSFLINIETVSSMVRSFRARVLTRQ